MNKILLTNAAMVAVSALILIFVIIYIGNNHQIFGLESNDKAIIIIAPLHKGYFDKLTENATSYEDINKVYQKFNDDMGYTDQQKKIEQEAYNNSHDSNGNFVLHSLPGFKGPQMSLQQAQQHFHLQPYT